jgi:hypothetical protein
VAPVTATSAFNNVVQRVSGALGLAVLTAILVKQQAEQMAGRAALVPANAPTPHLGPPGTPDWLGDYATYRMTQLQVFVGAIGDLFLIASGLSLLAALGALMLRSGPAAVAAPPSTTAPPPRAAAPPGSTNGQPGLVPSASRPKSA